MSATTERSIILWLKQNSSQVERGELGSILDQISTVLKNISITKDTKKEAEYSALEYRTGRKKVCCADNMLLTDAMGDYITLKTQVLSPTTIRAYNQIRRNHLQNIITLPLSDITNELIQVEINKISCTLSPKTVRNVFGLLSAVYNQFNPTFNLHITLPQKQRFIPNIPSVEDIKNILRFSKGSEIELAVLLALCLGLRMSEIRALKFFKCSRKFIAHHQCSNTNRWRGCL